MEVGDHIKNVIAKAAGVDLDQVKLEHPEADEHGDYSSNIAMTIFSKSQIQNSKSQINSNTQILRSNSPRELAEEIALKIKPDEIIEKVGVAGPGFVNIFLRQDFLVEQFEAVDNKFGRGQLWEGKKIMVEYAHPNTHKELHIGHMRTLITGEAIARISEFAGARVFRANYQGDIGPHVAKAIWGTQQILKEKGLKWEDVEDFSDIQKAHLLGEGYVKGVQDYDAHKEEIDTLNTKIYKQDDEVKEIYDRTRRWSLKYYDLFYERFGTKFDKLYFESEMAGEGKRIVLENVGRVFTQSDGAIIFDGEKHGLHKRVFVTGDGNPTYEGKEMALAKAQFDDFAFDQNIHVVANEQKGYFEVVIKALELLNPVFVGREYHLPMGMVNLVGRKMSSRTGEILTVDGLLVEIKALLPVKSEDEGTADAITLGAVKYSVLRTHPGMNVAFDIKQSVNLEGNSGPYLQYTYARTQSVLAKSQILNSKLQINSKSQIQNQNKEELAVLRWIYRFPEVVEEAAVRYAPNLICNFLYELAQKYNAFYNRHSILGAEKEELIVFRLKLTGAVGQVLKNGLSLLGIEALERM